MGLGSLFRVIRELLHEAARDLAPTLIVVVIFQVFFIQRMPDSPAALIGGFAVVLLGLALFVKGLDAAIFPGRRDDGFRLCPARLVSLADLLCLLRQLRLGGRRAGADGRRLQGGGGLGRQHGCADAAHGGGARCRPGGGGRRLAHRPRHSIGNYLIPGYLLVIVLTIFSPPQLVGLAFDSGGVVASTVTAPLLTALGVGLATSIRGRNPMLDGFGLIAFGALAPMIIIQLYGIVFFVPAAAGTRGSDDAERRPASVRGA
jgi:hypothetical protein